MATYVHNLPADLAAFLAEASRGRRPQTSDRYGRVLEHLNRFVAEIDIAEVSRQLGTDCATLFAAEREFGAESAFWRFFGYDEMVCCLPGFLEGEWLLPRHEDARTQVSLTARLLRWMRSRGVIDMQLCGCAYWDAEYAVKKARARLEAQSRP